jgi:hypothetical protein
VGPMLYSRRKRQAELAAREASGEMLWTESVDEAARARLVHAFRDSVGPHGIFYDIAREAILHDEGRFYLLDPTLDPAPDLTRYLLCCPDAMVPTVIEAMDFSCKDRQATVETNNWHALEYFGSAVNVILREHRISYELINGQMVEFSSMELHQQVVAPALRLLAGRSDLDKVEFAYGEALREIADGNAANAITDAATALQEMFNALGWPGNSLGPQIKFARENGILAPHDSPMLHAIEKLLNWVSADRSEKGDAHAVTSVALDDAWLIVHVVGAVILRLSRPTTRGDK